jgi:N-acylneuraminate cytidylyltransferase
LLAHSIGHARGAAEITRVVVSTDDPEIAEAARANGAEVVLRPPEISGDHASSESALMHVLKHLEESEDYQPDLVVFLQATSPIRKPGDLDQAIRKLRTENADSLFSASRLNWFAWRIEGTDPTPLNYDHRNRPMRQVAPLDVIETGSFYIFKPWVLTRTGSRLGGRVSVYMTDFIESLQIDEPEDLDLLASLLPRVEPKPQLGDIQLLVLDFDGVLTDNYVWTDQHGNESVRCSRADSLGINRLQASGVEIVVLSTETNGVVAQRCRKLGIECFQGHHNKAAVLSQIVRTRGLDTAQVAYLGNDVNDLECLRYAGFPISVCDAHPEVKAIAKLSTQARGGDGAVREVCDLIVQSRSERPGELSLAAAKQEESVCPTQ